MTDQTNDIAAEADDYDEWGFEIEESLDAARILGVAAHKAFEAGYEAGHANGYRLGHKHGWIDGTDEAASQKPQANGLKPV